jgi:hypothetical protein
VRGLACIAALCALVSIVGTSAAVAAPTKPQFIRQGDALCTRTAREFAPLMQRVEAARSLPEARVWPEVAAIWGEHVRLQTRFARRFGAIGVPARDAAAASLVNSLATGPALARAIRDAAKARSDARLGSATAAYIRFTTALNRRVRAYGFRVCGRM